MPRLQLISLLQLNNEEQFDDDPYILVNGEHVWEKGGIKAQGEICLRKVDPISFEGEAVLELKNTDAKDWEDSLLGSLCIQNDKFGLGRQEHFFSKYGAVFRLVYEVLP